MIDHSNEYAQEPINAVKILHFLPVLMLACGWCPAARADGGTVRLVERQGGFQVSVFTSPNPLRVGPVDISVLLQDSETLAPMSASIITLNVTPRGGAGHAIHCFATVEAATNKLFRDASVELPEPGWWDVEVDCEGAHGGARVRFAMDVAPPLPGWMAAWPWFCWPLVVVLLFGAHRYLAWHQVNRSRAAGMTISCHSLF
jgi:hypothetical protein